MKDIMNTLSLKADVMDEMKKGSNLPTQTPFEQAELSHLVEPGPSRSFR
jgi:hypothetical protein